MCFSLKTSVISFSIGMLSSLFAYLNNQKGTALFTFFYSLMQLSEILIWYGLDHDNTSINRLGTLIGKYTLPLHGVAIGIGLIWTTGKTNAITLIPLIVGICVALYVFLVKYSINMPTITRPYNGCSKPECQNLNNRLKWPYPQEWYRPFSILFSLFMMFYLKPFPLNIVTPLFYLLSGLIVSHVFPHRAVVGSVWCVMTAVSAPLLVILQYRFKGRHYIL